MNGTQNGVADAATAGTWTLTPAESAPATESMLLASQMTDGNTESAFDPDNRTVVAAADFLPGGKYRCMPSDSQLL